MKVLVIILNFMLVSSAIAQENTLIDYVYLSTNDQQTEDENTEKNHKIAGAYYDWEIIESTLSRYGLKETIDKFIRLRSQVLEDPDNKEYFDYRDDIVKVCFPNGGEDGIEFGTFIKATLRTNDDGSQFFEINLFTAGYYFWYSAGVSYGAKALVSETLTRKNANQSWKRSSVNEIKENYLQLKPHIYNARYIPDIHLINQSEADVLEQIKLNLVKSRFEGPVREYRSCQERYKRFLDGEPLDYSRLDMIRAERTCKKANGELRSIFGEVRETYQNVLAETEARINEIENPSSLLFRNRIGQAISRKANASELAQLRTNVGQLTSNILGEISKHKDPPACQGENPAAVNNTTESVKETISALRDIKTEIKSSAKAIKN